MVSNCSVVFVNGLFAVVPHGIKVYERCLKIRGNVDFLLQSISVDGKSRFTSVDGKSNTDIPLFKLHPKLEKKWI